MGARWPEEEEADGEGAVAGRRRSSRVGAGGREERLGVGGRWPSQAGGLRSSPGGGGRSSPGEGGRVTGGCGGRACEREGAARSERVDLGERGGARCPLCFLPTAASYDGQPMKLT
jgi:hypothetical protein